MYKNRGVTSRALASLRLVAVLMVSVIIGCSQATDVTELEDQRVADIYPDYQLDTSFVGDTVISPVPLFWSATCSGLDELVMLQKFMDALEGRASFPACGGLGNFDITWNSSNPSVSSKVGSPSQHVTLDYSLVRAASASTGTARLSFTSSLEMLPAAKYAHDIVVLPTPDHIEVPAVINLAVGETTQFTASVRSESGPRVNTGAVLWGPGNSVASITTADTTISRKQTDGRIVTTLNNPIVVKGLAPGEMQLTVQYKKARSVLETAAAVSGPVMFEKKVLVLVGASLKIVANPAGPQADPANTLVSVTVGSTRQYNVLDQNNAAVPNSSITWLSVDPTIASVDASGLAKCLTAGKATIKATRTGTTVSTTTTITCAAAPAASLAMFLDPVAAEYTGASAGNFYRARLIDAQGNEVSPSSDGGVITYSSSDNGAITIDASTGFASAKALTATRTATLTATYTKNNQVIATATSAVTVNSVAADGFGAVQFSVTGDVRRIRVNRTIQFEVIVRDKNGIKQLPGTITAPALTVSSSSLEITPVASSGGFFYNMTAKSLPSSSALSGVANAVTIKASVAAASATLPMVIVP